MDKGNAIELTNICKTFKVEVADETKEKTLFNRSPTKIIDNKIFDNLNIKVKKGEMLGIIGLNGSGKSTLLSIMARIMEPDSGTVEINGKVASILELGMGFHPDLSGRENIYIKGEMYGFTKAQMDEKVEEIIDFTGIRYYIDNPLRTYSSGMSGRLAFSIMVHVDAEVMMLDEIMSTGDASFTAKADNLFKRQLKSGKTIVFASQNFEQIEQLCTRAIWISKGKIVADGPVKSVCAMFRNSVSESVDIITDFANSGVPDAQYKLALLYRDGTKIGKDEALYKLWLGKAASQGHTLAQVAYADILMDSGSEQDKADAFALYQSAAMKGNGDAKRKLSTLADNRSGARDIEEIRGIVRQLAEIGHPSHKLQYASLLLNTAWNDTDRQEAFRWYVMCADEGNPDAMYQVAVMCRDGIGTVKDVGKYVEYLGRGARLGHPRCIGTLADTYVQGKLVVKDDAKAFELYKKSAMIGNAGHQYQVAVMYRDGIGTEKNQEEADKWFASFSSAAISGFQVMAAEQMKAFPLVTEATMESLLLKAASSYNQRAIALLGALYRGDFSNPPDIQKSRHYYEQAALVFGGPQLSLADMCYKGFVFDQDYKKAADLYKDLTCCCDANVDYRLYLMYRDGLGLEKNEEAAMRYLKRSASRGNPEAQRELRNVNDKN